MYQAAVVELKNVRPHPNADRLQLADVLGFQVIVGIDNKEGEKGLFFPTDGQLSQDFAHANNLIAVYDTEGKKISGGMFDHKRRVRSIRLRGEGSDGVWLEISCLDYIGESDVSHALPEGTTFNEWTRADGEVFPICGKYETARTKAAQNQAKGTKSGRRETPSFPMNGDTTQLRFGYHDILPGDHIIISLKIHGTSQRQGLVYEKTNVPEYRKYPWWRSWFEKLLGGDGWYEVPVEKYVWRHLLGTRQVIIRDDNNGGYYGTNEFREKAALPSYRIGSGEVFFYEVSGFVTPERPIMDPHSPSKINDKEFAKRYADPMYYRYGTDEKRAVRITKTWLYGGLFNTYVAVGEEYIPQPAVYTWKELQYRAEDLGVQMPPVLAEFDFDGDYDALLKLCEELREGPDPIDPSHIREGVVVRVERYTESGTLKKLMVLKDKSRYFGMMEGYIKDTGAVDMEEAGGVIADTYSSDAFRTLEEALEKGDTDAHQ